MTTTPPTPEQRPKLSYIAKLTGTTPSTVSKVINGRDGVSERTREHIEATLQRLGYSKPPVRHATSATIAVVSMAFNQPWIPNMLQGANDYAISHGMTVTVCTKSNTDRTRDDRYLTVIRRAKPLAVVFDSAYVSMQDRTLAQETQFPYVVVDPSGTPSRDCAEVRIDNWAGGWEAGRHLLELGHRRFAVITGDPALACFPARVDGFRAALREAGVMLDERMIVDGDNWMERSRSHALRLLSADDRPTAIFACSDIQAYGVYDAAHQLGLSIPDDLSVIGFDDIESSSHLAPPLTTIRQPFADMTRMAFELLLDRRDPSMPDKLLVPPALVARGSTAPPCDQSS